MEANVDGTLYLYRHDGLILVENWKVSSLLFHPLFVEW